MRPVDPAKNYYQWMVEAKALGFASVQAMTASRFPDRAWTPLSR